MKRICISQRVESVASYGERRDCLDQRWFELIFRLGYVPVPLPNVSEEHARQLLADLQPHAVILSGGNSIASLDPSASDVAPERDAFESAVVAHAVDTGTPVIGVCRGMQVLNLYFGGELLEIDGHVATRHPLRPCSDAYSLPIEVNSYHQYCIPATGLSTAFTPLGFDEDGNIEAFCHKEKRILGIMWHPEREKPYSQLDFELMKRFVA